MGRKITHWPMNTPESPAEATVAPDHYAPGNDRKDWALAEGWDEFLARVLFKEGDVVWLERGGEPVKALIVGIGPDRDSDGFRRPKFRVSVATKAGHWSRNWERSFSGFIQRGYLAAKAKGIA